mgnify:CR=1 FL=1
MGVDVSDDMAVDVSDDVPLIPGTRVLISGLNGRPELNGTHGTILSFDQGKGRFAVNLDSDEKILLKPVNASASQPCAPCAPCAPLCTSQATGC